MAGVVGEARKDAKHRAKVPKAQIYRRRRSRKLRGRVEEMQKAGKGDRSIQGASDVEK